MTVSFSLPFFPSTPFSSVAWPSVRPPADVAAAAALQRPPARVVALGSGIGDWFGEYVRDPGRALARLLDLVERLAPVWAPIAGPGLVVAVAAVLVGRRVLARWRHERLTAGARQITVLPPPQVDQTGGEALWTNLVGLLRPPWRRALAGQPHLGFEYLFDDTGVVLHVWVPGVIPPGLVERAIQAAWPGSHTTTGPATPPLPSPPTTTSTTASTATSSTASTATSTTAGARRQVVIGGQLRLGRGEALPIRTRFDADPIRGLLGAPVGLGAGEHACVQILARPVTGRRVLRARTAARRAAAGSAARPAGQVLDLLTGMLTGRFARPRSGTSNPTQHVDPQTAMEITARNRAVVGKQTGSQYETAIVYAVATTVPARADRATLEAALAVSRGRAHALASAFAAYSEHNRYRRTRLRHPAAALAGRRLGRGDLLSVPELAALAHLPTDEHIPGLARAGAQAVPPPPGIAAPGPGVKRLGITDTAPERPVGLRVVDARQHLHMTGATGSGKSTELCHMTLDEVADGRGGVVIDPKGDLIIDLLDRLPASCADRVVLLDADSRHRPPCLNPLDPTTTLAAPHGRAAGPLGSQLAVDNLVSVFARLYSATWGPRTDDVMRACCLTLIGAPRIATLADIPPLLTDPAYRARLLTSVTDPVLRGFWAWYDALSDAGRGQVIAPLLNKLRAFLLRPFARAALAGGPADLDMTDILDGGLLLVRIPKGRLGDETCRLVGSLVVARVWQAATARAAIPQHQRRDAFLVIDECHNFLNLPYAIQDMLAEARGFRLAMTLAHQNLAQLPRDLREGIATNARSKIFFTAGPDDARDLARHTLPRLTEHDLSHLGAFHAAARLVNHGAQTPAFTLRTEPLPAPIPGRARLIRAAAARRPRPVPVVATPSAPPPPAAGVDPRHTPSTHSTSTHGTTATTSPGARRPSSLRQGPRPGPAPPAPTTWTTSTCTTTRSGQHDHDHPPHPHGAPRPAARRACRRVPGSARPARDAVDRPRPRLRADSHRPNRLHHGRRPWRGGAGASRTGTDAALHAAPAHLVSSGPVSGAPVSSALVVGGAL